MKAIQTPGLLRVVFSLMGLSAGMVVTLSFISGDDQGRVNLLYLLLLFVFVPVCGFLISCVALCLPRRKGLAGWLLEIPFWPRGWLKDINGMPGGDVRQAWLFYLSQLLALALGIGCLIAFIFVLLLNDVSFVWRSTFLEASDLLPVLGLLALPWSIWPEAQPSLELLQLSQDFRLGEQNQNAGALGQWWKYALAAQVTYNLLPRSVMLLVSHFVLVVRQDRHQQEIAEKTTVRFASNSLPEEGKLAQIAHKPADPYVLINWASVPDEMVDYVVRVLGAPRIVETRAAAMGASATCDPANNVTRDATIVILVKSWEPPLAELRDFLESRSSTGMILPLDWDAGEINEVREIHLAEWRRFCGTLEGWAVLLPLTD